MAHPAVSAAIVAVISFLAVFIYARAGILYLFYANAPSRLEHVINVRDPVVKFPDVVRNCEDVYLNEIEGWALLSCDPGRDTWNTVMGTFVDPNAPPETGLYLWHYADRASPPPEQLKLLDFRPAAGDFHPLGIDYLPTSKTLFVSNHAESGSRIEMFRLFPDDTAATHIRTLQHPLIRTPNSIAALSETEILFTNDHHFLRRYSPFLNLLETYSGLPLANIAVADLTDDKVSVRKLASAAFPNGIALLNSSSVAVASTVDPSVLIFALSRNAETNLIELRQTRKIPISHHVDNLSVDGNGNLLLAGHPHVPSLEAVAKGTFHCSRSGAEHEQACASLPKPNSWIQEWSEEGGLRTLYLGDALGTVCTAVRDVTRGIGIAPGLYGRGILTWRV